MEWLKRIIGTSRRTPTSTRVPQTSGALIRALEPRMMFDGAAVATTVDAAQTADATQTDASASDPTTDQASAPSAAQPDGSGVATTGPQVVFIDSRLDGYQQLLGAIRGDVEVVVLDGSGNALEQMAQWAESHQGYSAIHLVGHGSSGSLQLGDLWLQEGTIAEQQPLLAQLGAALSTDGDILLYGCDVAAGSQGVSFVDALAAATGADVAASTDATGSTSRGGDWELEYRSGNVEAPLVLDTQQLAGTDILLALPSNGVKDLTELTSSDSFFPGFTLVTSNPLLGDPGDNTLAVNGVYLDSMPGELSGYFAVSADGSNLGSFDLTGIHFAKYTNDGNFTFTVTGYKPGGGEVTTTFTTFSGSNSFSSGTYTNFTGITGFRIQIDGDFLNTSNVTFDSFTVANVAAPDVAPSLVATGSNPTFTEKGSAVDLFSGVSALTNDSGQTFTGMTLTVANLGNGTSEKLNIAGTDIPLVVSNGSIAGIGSYDISQTGNTVNITLSGLSLSETQMSALIDGMTYRNASNDPTGASRVVTITSLTDSGYNNSHTVTTASSTVSIAPVNDAPSLSVPSSIHVTEDVASPLTGLSFGDADAGGNSVTVVLSEASGLGTLAAVSGGGVTVSGSGSASLSLSGSIAALNAFVAAGNLTYTTASNATADATLLVSIDDGGNTGSGGAKSANTQIALQVDAVNDAPSVTVSGSQTVVEDIPTPLGGIVFSDVDAGSGNVTVILSEVDDLGSLAAVSGGNVTVSGSGSTQLTLSGSIADINAFIAAGNVTYTTASNANIDVRLLVSIDDGGNTGSGGAKVTNRMVYLQVVAVNDPPALIATGGTPTYTENGSAVDLFSGVGVGAGDSGQAITGLTLTVANLADGSQEILTIEGTDIPLIDGFSTTTAVTGMTASVSLVGGTATVTLSKASGLSASSTYDLVNGITYRNESDAPSTATPRVVTLTSITDNGGTANGGIDTAALSIAATVTVAATNDAPTLSAGAFSLTGTDEDHASNGTAVSALLSGLGYGDGDGPGQSGIAIGGATGNGIWQYSTDGSTWTDLGTVSASSALLLSASSQLRYVPDGRNGETATLSLRAWDQTSGTASATGVRSFADTASNGGSTAFSSSTATASLLVSPVNDAPSIITASVWMSPTNEDTPTASLSISDLLGALNRTDVDNGALSGVAITSATSNGNWQYSNDGGASWADFGSVSDSAALLLDSSALIRYQPDGIHGETASFALKAWDQSSGTASTNAVRSTGDTTSGSAYSSATVPFTLVVTEVADATVVTTSGGSATFIEADGAGSIPVAIDPGLTLSDPDSATLASATVTISGNFYSGQDLLSFVNDGSTMGNIVASYDAGTGTLTLTSAGASASLGQWQAALRAVSYGNSSETPNTATRVIAFSVNDGGVSSNSATRLVGVVDTNDTPSLSMPSSIRVTEDIASPLTGLSFGDADAGGGSVTVVLSEASALGSLAAVSGGNVTVSGSGSASLTLSGSIADLNAFVAAGNVTYTTASNATADASLLVSIDDGGNTGSGGAKLASTQIVLQVDAVNDAPGVTVPVSQTVVEDVPSPLSGIVFDDVDAGSGSVTATLSVSSGTLAASGGGTVTVAGSGTAILTLNGTLADLNAFISGNGVSFATASDSTASITLSVALDDGGNSGAGGNRSALATTTLMVSAVNDAPVNGMPGAQAVDQDSALVFGTAHGNAITVSDVDAAGGSLRVTLTAGNGLLTLAGISGLSFLAGDGANDASMTFEGSLTDINQALDGLRFTPTPGYNGQASLQIVSDDQGLSGSGGAQSDTDSIAITVNSVSPLVTGVSASSPDGGYKVGDQLLLTVTFDQAVIVDTSGGTPSLLLETGATDRSASYLSGSGSNTLTFAYTVQAGDVSADLDYASTGAFALNGATIRNVSSDDAILALPAPGGLDSIAGQRALVIDGNAPTVTGVAVPPDATYVAGQNLDFVVDLSEAVVVDTAGGTPRLAVDIGGTTRYAEYVSGSGSSALVFRYQVQTGDHDGDGIAVGGVIEPNGGSLRDGVGNALQPALNGVADSAGVRVDAVAPTVSAIVRESANPTSAGSLSYRVTFDEAVSGVDAGDFVLATTGSAHATLSSVVQLDPRTYRVVLDGVSGEGSLTLQLAGAGSGIVDQVGNALLAGASGESYTRMALTGDPQFRITTPGSSVALGESRSSLGPVSPTPDHGVSPLSIPPLLQPERLGGLPPLASLFGEGGMPPGFIAGLFGRGMDGSGTGQGFDTSGLAALFADYRMTDGPETLLDNIPGDAADSGAPSLGQQLHELQENQRRRLGELARALRQMRGA